MKLKKFFVLSSLFAMLFSSAPVLADVDVTSSLRGNVNVSGATIVAKHTPTGISKVTTAGDSGNFTLSFLPVGGPYEITASAPGYSSERLEGVFLVLSETASISVTLARSAMVKPGKWSQASGILIDAFEFASVITPSKIPIAAVITSP